MSRKYKYVDMLLSVQIESLTIGTPHSASSVLQIRSNFAPILFFASIWEKPAAENGAVVGYRCTEL